MKKNKTTHVMSAVLMLLFVVMFLTLSGRFLYIQGTGEVAGVSLQEWADERRTNTYEIEAQRGTIYDRNGMVLAQDRATYRIYAIVDKTYTSNPKEPKHVEDPQHTAEMLAPLLDMEQSEILSRLQTGIEEDRFQVEFGTKGKELSQERKEEIDELELPGIKFMEESKRYYPNGLFASRIIGLAQKKDDLIQGITGIERQFNDKLLGENGSISYKRDKFNIKLLEADEILKEAKDGNDVYLTIDQKIQTLLEDSMSQVMEEYDPERITAVVMDPETGEVLAMSNRPSYNPNDIGAVENWYNDVISTPIEPGSTMKIFTLAAAIEEGVYNPGEFYESGSYINKYMTRPIKDHHYGGWGTITFEEGIQRSSNVAAIKLAWDKMGPDTFLNYLNAFDFDQPTEIDLPGEQPGYILYNRPVEQITTSFGQGTTVTPIQLMKATTAIANQGQMVKPYVVSKVVDSSTGEAIQEGKTEVVSKPISANTAKKVVDTLETVITSENGTGHNVYNLNGYSVAGKTGTAQIPDSETRKYMTGHENYLFSFLGMAPKDDPELIMYVSVKQPNLDELEPGSAPTSFIFKNVMENSLHYLNIKPDKGESEPIHTITVPKLIGKTTPTIKEQLEKEELEVTVIGNGETVTKSNMLENEEVLPGDHVMLVTDSPIMPDITDWSLREVLTFADLLQLDLEIMGNGYVKTQSIEKGKPISENNYLIVELSSSTQGEQSQEETEINSQKED